MGEYTFFARLDDLEAAVCAENCTEAERGETIEFIESAVGSLIDYANHVIRQTLSIPLWKRHWEGYDLLTRIEASMHERNRIHDAAIVSMRALNRLCGNYGVEPIFALPDGDPSVEAVRTAAARSIGALAAEAYAAGTGEDRIGKPSTGKNPASACLGGMMR